MTILTRAQKINRQRIAYKVPEIGSDIIVPVYFPIDEAGTSDIYNIGRMDTIQTDFDFIDGIIVGEGVSRSLNVTNDLTSKLAPSRSNSRSFAMLYAITAGAFAAWGQFKLGTASGTKGEVDLTFGDVTISQVTGTADNLTYTSIASSGVNTAIALIFDQPTNEWLVYEALEGKGFTLMASLPRTIGSIVLANITPVTFNNTVGQQTFGAATYYMNDPNISFPANFLTKLATTKDNWIGGVKGLTL